jgi:hypothetical protein
MGGDTAALRAHQMERQHSPWASLPLSAGIHLSVPNNSYDRMYR